MGSGASAGLSASIVAASAEELKQIIAELSAYERTRLVDALTAGYLETSHLIDDDVIFHARAPSESIAAALMPASLELDCQRENAVFMLGPSHLDSNLCHIHGIVPRFEDGRGMHFSRFLPPDSNSSGTEPAWATPIDVMGYAGLPVHNRFTLEMLKRAYTIYDGRVIWMVPDFRFNNLNVIDLQQKRAAEARGDCLFLDVGFGPANIHASFMTAYNDSFLLEYGLDCVDHIVAALPNVRLLFWCAFFRTYGENASTQGIYKDLYNTLVSRYPRNILDIRSYMSPDDVLATRAGGKFWRDRSGHPSSDGYRLIHKMALSLVTFPSASMTKMEPFLPEEHREDSMKHDYFIVGTWSRMAAEPMVEHPNAEYTFDVTIGANSWEMFHILQDNDLSKKICPGHPWATKDQPCIGPHGALETSWLLDVRRFSGQDDSDTGRPGDKFRIRLSPNSIKRLEWSKVSDAQTAIVDDGSYSAVASWQCWGLVELQPVAATPGTFSLEVQMTKLNLKFQLLRNADVRQRIYPECTPGATGTTESCVLGVGASAEDMAAANFNVGRGVYWMIDGRLGDVFNIFFHRNPHDLASLSVWWEFVETRPVVPVANRYFLCGTMNRWGEDDEVVEMKNDNNEGAFVVDVRITQIPMEFYMLENNFGEMVIQPDKRLCTQRMTHNILGPHAEMFNRKQEKLTWAIGKCQGDGARIGDIFQLKFEPAASMRVTWSKQHG